MRIGKRPAIAAFCVLLAGCADNEVLPEPGAEVALGPYSVVFDPVTETVTLRGDSALLTFGKEAFELGLVPEIGDLNYDPYRLYETHPLYDAPPIDWRSPVSMSVVEANATTFLLELDYDLESEPGDLDKANLQVIAEAEGRFRVLWVLGPQNAAFHRLRPLADETEGFYGLGEQFDDVDQRGKIRAMQLEQDGGIESGYNEAHVPIPLLIGTRGWGLFVGSDRPGAFAVAAGDEPDRIEAAFGTGGDATHALDFYLFAADRPLDVTRRYYEVTGYPKLPARWALGPWVWRDEVAGQEQVLSDVQTIRDLDLATTGYWIDRPYATAVNTFDFEASTYADPQAMIDEIHALGFRTALWHTPYLDEKGQTEETAALRMVAEQEGYYPLSTGLVLNKWGRPLDFTNEEAYAWWQSLIQKYTEMGVEGFKLDYAEDVVPGLTLERNPWEFHDGTDERTMNKGYPRIYHQVYAETLPTEGGFLLCRAGAAGDQKNGPILWPGDLDASFGKHREKLTDAGGDTYTGVGGLPASIVAGLSLGPSGFPFFGADTGGYKHAPPDKELFMRWFEQTAFSAVMQIGTSSNTVAWDFMSGPGFDEELLDRYREYTRWHLRLFPYLWTYAVRMAGTPEAPGDGVPIARALGLAHPELGAHPNDEYLLGDHLLVAPVVERGATEREVLLPEGKWVHFLRGDVLEGPGAQGVAAPLGEIPVFLAAGGLVPLLRPTIDTMSPVADEAAIDSYATTPGVLYVRTTPGPASEMVVFDGATLSQAPDGMGMTLSMNDGSEFQQGFFWEILAFGDEPSSVTVDGAPLGEAATIGDLTDSPGWTMEASLGGTLWVRVDPGPHTVKITR